MAGLGNPWQGIGEADEYLSQWNKQMDEYMSQQAKQRQERSRTARVASQFINSKFRDAAHANGIGFNDVYDVARDRNGGTIVLTHDGRQITLGLV